MANRSLAITISLIIQLSVNTIPQVGFDVNEIPSYNNKNYINIGMQVPAELIDEVLIPQSIYNFVEEPALVNSSITETIEEHTNSIESVLVKQERTIDPNKPMIALTFDDGPSKYTEELLDVLKENNSVATFFVLGLQVNKFKEVIPRMIDEGNQIGNHSFDHKRLTTLSDDDVYDEINKTDSLVYEAAFYKPYVMRPPYGSTSNDLIEKLQKPIVKWSIDTRDWESRNTEAITEVVLNNVKDGDIILMHDLYNSTLEASEIVIPELVKRGFQLVTIDELFEFREATYMAGATYYNMYKVNEK